MKNIRNSKACKLLTSILIILLLFNFVFPTYSHATDSWYGDLFEPIARLLLGTGDTVLNFMQGQILGYKAVTKIDPTTWSWKDLIWGVVPVVGLIRNVGKAVVDLVEYDDIALSIGYGPATIFSNKIPLFSIDFFTVATDEDIEKAKETYSEACTDFGVAIQKYANEWQESDDTKLKEFALKFNIIGITLGTFMDDEDKIEEAWELYIEYAQYMPDDVVQELETKSYTLIDTAQTYYSAKGDESSIAGKLKKTISSWYRALQSIALVLLLSVLVYIGIRIIISSTSTEKAKYKTLIKDWIIAVVLIFVLHYLMVGIVTFSNELVNIFSQYTEDGDSLMKEVRLEAYYASTGSDETSFSELFGYTVMYLTLVIYTLLFTFKYLKRVVYMAFLTMIAPLICLTYPLDKVSDGQAQAFNMWFKEYLYNALIQVMHLVLYVVLISSAIDLAKENILYAIVSLGFVLQGEKILKQMFGFNKAQGGALSSAVTGAAMMQGINMLTRKAIPHKAGNDKSNVSNQGTTAQSSKPRLAELMSGAYPGNGGADTGTDTGVGAGVGTGTDTGAGAGAGTDTGAGAGAGTDTGAGAGAGAGARQGVNPITQTGTNEGRIKKLKRKIANSPTAAGLGAVGKKYIFNKNTGKKLLKGGLKGASMATLGTLGVAAGLASDNFSNVFTYGAAATMAGSKVGDNLYNLGGNIISGTKNGVQDVKDTYKYAKYGKEYAEQLDNKSIQQYFKNPDVIRTYQKKFANAQEASEAMEYAKECKKAGINDDDAIINSYKLNDSYSREQKKYIAGLSLTNTSGKDLKELKESLAERNLSNSQIKNIIDGIKNVNRMA